MNLQSILKNDNIPLAFGLGILCLANFFGLAFVGSMFKDTVVLLKDQTAIAAQVETTKGFVVKTVPVRPEEYKRVSQSIFNQFSGLKYQSGQNSLTISSEKLEDYPVFRNAVLAATNSAAEVRWKFVKSCMGNCTGPMKLSAELTGERIVLERKPFVAPDATAEALDTLKAKVEGLFAPK